MFREVGIEGVIAHSANVTNVSEDVGASVVDGGDLAMFHDVESLDLRTVFDCEALKAETNTEYRDEVFIGRVP